jgi:diguanylate cyclase (GGDEF)-like protein
MRILVIDDDEILVELVKQSLTEQRHVVDTVEDGQMGWEYVQSGEYELILLDIDLPQLDGVSLCEKIRSEEYKIPILLMTAHEATEDRIRGLDAGADDYLTKPLNLGELNARIRALSRRGEVIPTTVLNVNGLILNPSSCEVSYQNRPIKLTAKEYSLLELFLRNPTRVFSRSQILDKIWTFDDPPLEESVKAHIKGLRKKLNKARLVHWIENVYGIGYRLNPEVVKSQSNCSSDLVESEFNQKLEQMWLQYQDKMLERMQILKNASITLQETELNLSLPYNVERAAHKLAGVLGMFNRDTGSAIAKDIETLLQDHPILNSAQKQQFISLVADLDSLLGLSQTAINDEINNAAKLLLISEDTQLAQELQQIAKTEGLSWYRVEDLATAKIWLQTHSPYVLGIDLEITKNKAEYLALISELTARTPSVSSFILAATDSLSGRVMVARAGANGYLVKPTTPSTVWQTTNQLLKRQKSAIASILIVDDDAIFLATLHSMLEPWGIRVTTLEHPLRFWEVLQATQPDLLILDVEMPEINGIELCQALRSDPHWQELPTLFLTARRDAETIQQVFAIGGDDYISKPVVVAELLARIDNRLTRSRFLNKLARQDRVTGLKNRSQSNYELEKLMQQAQKLNISFCFGILKMPELAVINLKYGHDFGDRILGQWGKIIQAAFRKDEITSYWGNGDFILAMPNLDRIQGQEYLAEVLTILRKQIFTTPLGNRIQVTCNCLLAEFPHRGTTLSSLYQACFC